jgi:hypothetical protein
MTREKATHPEDIARLFVEFANAGDAEAMAELYEPDAVLDFPLGTSTVVLSSKWRIRCRR